jgi:CheY-like chemotaxis protein
MSMSSDAADSMTAYKVLCVDDEQRVLDALRRHLRERFEVLTATGGAQALQIMGQHKDLAVIVSDMRMPEMDGATLLRHTRAVRPSAVRILLTGQADMAAAIKAINEGQIFRFLTKPCAPEQFLSVMDEAIRQHELIVAERVLLQRTLVGAIKALTDIMTLVSPAVVGRAQRLKRRVSALAIEMNLEDRWQVEIAALLSYLGQVSLPDFLTHKLSRGRELDPEESIRVESATRAANRLIAHVPRLEPVSAILTALSEPTADDDLLPARQPDGLHVQVLRLAMEAERLEAQGLRSPAVLEALQASGDYPATLLAAVRTALNVEQGTLERAEIPVAALTIGMVLDEDVKTTRDILIAPRGCEVTLSFIEHIGHFTKQLTKPTIAVLQSAGASDSTDEVPGLAIAVS